MKPDWIIANMVEGDEVRLRLDEIAAYRLSDDGESCLVWLRAQQDEALFELVPEMCAQLDAIFRPRRPKDVL